MKTRDDFSAGMIISHVGENADAIPSKGCGQACELLLTELSGSDLSGGGELRRQHVYNRNSYRLVDTINNIS